jgi:hypothetical protein
VNGFLRSVSPGVWRGCDTCIPSGPRVRRRSSPSVACDAVRPAGGDLRSLPRGKGRRSLTGEMLREDERYENGYFSLPIPSKPSPVSRPSADRTADAVPCNSAGH